MYKNIFKTILMYYYTMIIKCDFYNLYNLKLIYYYWLIEFYIYLLYVLYIFNYYCENLKINILIVIKINYEILV